MTDEEFEQLVNEGMKAIPKKFLDLMDNVAVTIEDAPTYAQMRKNHLQPGWTLFGLYEGVPRTKRGPSYAGVLPDKITIFRGPIEQAALASGGADAEAAIKEIVKRTVWHEIAHHFGLDEAGVRKAEKNRRR
jgi:predicted Zn-dependent protease with MMP-like domain